MTRQESLNKKVNLWIKNNPEFKRKDLVKFLHDEEGYCPSHAMVLSYRWMEKKKVLTDKN